MQDEETSSEWSHILGAAMAGPLKGKKLSILPSMMTNWRTWSEKYPETTATRLTPTADYFRSEMLQKGREFGFGLVRLGKARFWRFDLLIQQPLVNDEFGVPLVIYFDRPSHTPVAWERKVADRVLTFEKTEQGVIDQQTKSSWDMLLGRATAGPLAGTELKALPAIVSFSRAWQRFHPDSTYWQPQEQP